MFCCSFDNTQWLHSVLTYLEQNNIKNLKGCLVLVVMLSSAAYCTGDGAHKNINIKITGIVIQSKAMQSILTDEK